MSGWTSMCAAMSWYDQSFLSVMDDTSPYLRALYTVFSVPLNEGVAGRAGAVASL
ncbi:hypothetical protein GCM10020227_07450 [Streptomyces flavovirens]